MPTPALTLLAVLAAAPADPVALRDGVDCAASDTPRHEGETHRCLFEPRAFGKRDYSTANGRAEQVFTTLGPDCGAIEILADEDDAQVPGRKRVSVLCEP